MFLRWIRRLAIVLAALAIMSLFLMMLQTVIDVLASNLAGRPIPGNLEIISVYHMVLVVFLPLAFVELKKEPIAVDLVYRMLPEMLKRCVLVAGYLITATFFGFLAWQTGTDALRSFNMNEMMMGAVFVTIWPAKLALPIGFAAALLMVVANAWQAATDPDFNPSPDTPEDAET
ncbi:TRAP transporter small permease [Sulfitobacter sp. PR48]|jgi:TRAP-type C4-dicarboxylate transport system permease small subunit|uniref:TRAP transporter small permease subunit n=1 Tax=unclassified Sulfitobacter TaxID=196795 RepID=UPI0022AEDC43|nr:MULTISPECIES: TRAP transporter small permease [unclassified Sulfitobacter]MCZ4258207.1 TRAP transporter small permease [Sulfitobacter sp. G21635-S1]MDD9721075.1 TRAP transporter small permease [Sulfitobacter sp. PR48]